MTKTAKAKKRNRPAGKKKSSRKSPRRPLFPALFFLITVCSLIAGFYLYSKFNGKYLQTGTTARTKPDQPANRLPDKSIKPGPRPDQYLSSTRETQSTNVKYYRLNQNYSQALPLTKNYIKTLNQHQIAKEILHLLTISRNKDLAPLPPKTKLLKAKFTPPMITLDISQDFVRGSINFGGRDEMLAVSCLTNSFLLNFPGYESLQILIEGQKKETLAGHIDISKPLHFQPSIND